jgi:hypothetical protein
VRSDGGAATEVSATNGIFLGSAVTAGQHEFVFEYRPTSLRWALRSRSSAQRPSPPWPASRAPPAANERRSGQGRHGVSSQKARPWRRSRSKSARSSETTSG